ncbi:MULTISPECIES: hypothetical protein [unclassified Streptomyces]|uniref:hypothetical protein n=1 Tax=unclassified Streptomyces TaxID=2593676 RepID=UPI002E0E1E5A|nr:hypothetical protein OG452_00285 [Streptomyces sp. NBC_01197]WSR73073.1 hypothetical protein OG452_34580 [Streptomyces sp. NBC_01197]WSS47218.1 hypothetical protein OG708_00270 [Streptomyces sp. NBC_01180]WSS53344.1 hypothetical protein OG708_34775 [Streptomyces sp. NBC_01180]
MRPRTPEPLRCRTWTVELRPHQGDCVLVCPQCTPDGGSFTLPSARAAVLAHLARHARRDALAPYLRTCQCHERGCRWHPRHRGCSGPVILVLAREHSGRTWRLADTCTACAAATQHAAIVPETDPGPKAEPPAPARPAGPGGQPGPHEQAWALVGNMLSYLAAALPETVTPQARLLAVQGALRSGRTGLVRLPGGLLRSMRMSRPPALAEELREVGWLELEGPWRGAAITAQLLDVTLLFPEPARSERLRACDWALRVATVPAVRTLPVSERLVALALAAHRSPAGRAGRIDSGQLHRGCGLDPVAMEAALRRLVDASVIAAWWWDLDADELCWIRAEVRSGAAAIPRRLV